jgi:hypothetical protein
MTIEITTRSLAHFLIGSHIDPKKVTLILRCADDETLAHVEAAILQWMAPQITGSIEGRYPPDPRRFTINGVQVRLSTFDVAPSPGSQS